MAGAEHGSEFRDLAALFEELELMRALEREAAFQVEPRPIPEGLCPNGIPLGHIAFMGDFDQTLQRPSGGQDKEIK